MKKKILIITGIAVLILAMASISFANGGHHFSGNNTGNYGYGHMTTQNYTEEELEEFHDERMARQKEAITQYLEDGKITQEQHDNWMTHADDMESFHEENGFESGFGHGGYGGCARTTVVQ